jgi:hypothetical protein
MDSAIIVAIIVGVIGPLTVAWFNRRDMKNRVGTPNGQGNLVQIVERLELKQDAFTVQMTAHTIEDARQFDELRKQIDELAA